MYFIRLVIKSEVFEVNVPKLVSSEERQVVGWKYTQVTQLPLTVLQTVRVEVITVVVLLFHNNVYYVIHANIFYEGVSAQ